MALDVQFVIGSHARCGQNLIRSYLNMHPDIACAWELFNPAHIVKPYQNAAKTLQRHCAGMNKFNGFIIGWRDIRERGGKVIGALPSGVRIIFLRRRNWLAWYASTVLAKQTRMYNSFESLDDRLPDHRKTVRLDPVDMLQAIEKMITNFGIASSKEVEALTLYYEDLAADPHKTINQAYAYIGAPQMGPLLIGEPDTRKMANPNLRELISNYDELKGYFNGTKHAQYFVDGREVV